MSSQGSSTWAIWMHLRESGSFRSVSNAPFWPSTRCKRRSRSRRHKTRRETGGLILLPLPPWPHQPPGILRTVRISPSRSWISRASSTRSVRDSLLAYARQGAMGVAIADPCHLCPPGFRGTRGLVTSPGLLEVPRLELRKRRISDLKDHLHGPAFPSVSSRCQGIAILV